MVCTLWLMHPIQTANIVLIIVGIILICSGPYIIYRTVQGIMIRRREDPVASLQVPSNVLNAIIAILFFAAGILFVINNLKGNLLEY